MLKLDWLLYFHKQMPGFSFIKRIKSFSYAFNGLRVLVKEEHNARIHLIAAIGVVFAGFYFHISATEWIALIFSIAMVFSVEALNTAIENLADFVSPESHHRIKKIKDLAAASVAMIALAALVTGFIIFLPHIAP